jgi:zinc protease
MPVRWHLWVLLVLWGFCVGSSAREKAAPGASGAVDVPAAVRAAVQALGKEERPVELRGSRGGAVYALLANGAEVLVKEKHNAPVVSVQAFVRTGAVHEGEWLGAGLSHFCEHLMFKGTARRPTGKLDREIRSVGGEQNAWTTADLTSFFTTCSAAGFATAVDATVDMLMDATFPPNEVPGEHKVVLKEIERSKDNPDDVLSDAFNRLRFQVSPYRVPVIGYPDRFRRVTRDEVWAYYKRRYAPQLTVFVAVGDFEAPEALVTIARAAGKWSRTSVAEPAIPDEPPQVAPREVTLAHPLCQVPKLELGIPIASPRHPDYPAIEALARLLGKGRSSRLYRAVVSERELATDISASNTGDMMGPWTLAISATLEKGKLSEARAAILDVLEAARRRAPTRTELARIQRQAVAEHTYNQVNAEDVARTLGTDWIATCDLDFQQRLMERIQALGPEDIRGAARTYLDLQKLNLAVLVPEEKLEPAPPRPVADEGARAKELQARVAALRSMADVADASALDPARAAGLTTFQVRLRSGLRLAVREDATLPLVHVAFACLGGQRWEPAGLEGSAALLAAMLDRGTRARSSREIDQEIERRGAILETSSGADELRLSLQCLREDLDALFAVSADCLLHAAFPEAELAWSREQAKTASAQEEENLLQLDLKALRPVLYPGHPYGRELWGTPESLARITAADLRRLHAGWVRPEHVAIAVVGDCTAERAVDLARRQLRWPRSVAPFAPPETVLPGIGGRKNVETVAQGVEGAAVAVAFRGTKPTDPDRDRLDLLDALLSGMGGRLFVAIREKQGLAYEVGSSHEPQADGGAFILYVQTDPARIQVCLNTLWAEVQKLRDQPIGAQELQEIENYLTGQDAIEMQKEGELAERLARTVLVDGGIERVFSRRERLLRLTAQDVQDAARKYLDPAAAVTAIVTPK